MTPSRAVLSRQLVALREQHVPPFNQREAAHYVGLSLRQYGRLERGQADASLATLRRIADAYGVVPQALADGGDPPRTIAAAPTAGDFARLEAKVDRLLQQLSALGPRVRR